VFDTIAGLPVHALMVHVPIVLIPLSALGAILIAARPKALRLFGVATVIAAVVGALASFVAKYSGQELAGRVGWPQEHVDPLAGVAYLVLLVVFWLFARGVPLNRHRPLWLKFYGGILIFAALFMCYLTLLTGISGTSATLSGVVEQSQPNVFEPGD
jgi:hypothetical protein